MQHESWQEVKAGDTLESASGTYRVCAVRVRPNKPNVLTIENASGIQYDTADHGVYEVAEAKQKLSWRKRLKMALAAAMRVWQETGR